MYRPRLCSQRLVSFREYRFARLCPSSIAREDRYVYRQPDRRGNELDLPAEMLHLSTLRAAVLQARLAVGSGTARGHDTGSVQANRDHHFVGHGFRRLGNTEQFQCCHRVLNRAMWSGWDLEGRGSGPFPFCEYSNSLPKILSLKSGTPVNIRRLKARRKEACGKCLPAQC